MAECLKMHGSFGGLLAGGMAGATTTGGAPSGGGGANASASATAQALSSGEKKLRSALLPHAAGIYRPAWVLELKDAH